MSKGSFLGIYIDAHTHTFTHTKMYVILKKKGQLLEMFTHHKGFETIK